MFTNSIQNIFKCHFAVELKKKTLKNYQLEQFLFNKLST